MTATYSMRRSGTWSRWSPLSRFCYSPWFWQYATVRPTAGNTFPCRWQSCIRDTTAGEWHNRCTGGYRTAAASCCQNRWDSTSTSWHSSRYCRSGAVPACRSCQKPSVLTDSPLLRVRHNKAALLSVFSTNPSLWE